MKEKRWKPGTWKKLTLQKQITLHITGIEFRKFPGTKQMMKKIITDAGRQVKKP